MAKKKPRAPRVVHVVAKTPASFRWLKGHPFGATINADGSFSVFDEHAWSQALSAAEAIEVK